MIEAKLWHGKVRRRAKPHPMRERRPRLGELVQIDGSPHDWFEGRAPNCTLILFVDDASNRVLAAVFVPVEETEAYMTALRCYIKKHGRPVALYADKHSIFYISDKEKLEERVDAVWPDGGETLDIELIRPAPPGQGQGETDVPDPSRSDRQGDAPGQGSSIRTGRCVLVHYLPVYRRFANVPAPVVTPPPRAPLAASTRSHLFHPSSARPGQTSPAVQESTLQTSRWKRSALAYVAPRLPSAKGSTATSPCCATASRCLTRPCSSGLHESVEE